MIQNPVPYFVSAWRLLLSEPADGPLNMAIDEAILLAVAQGRSLPTLRFYRWAPPCLSLGYAQPVADADFARLAALSFDCVRRPTGGKAILHADELTYSINAPQTDPRMGGGIVESYRRLSEGLLRGLTLLGAVARNDKTFTTESTESAEKDKRENSVDSVLSAVKNNPVCFITPSNYEITANGKKLIGSAQSRKQGMVLQHGSLPLAGDIARICEALAFPDEAARAEARRRVRERATTLEAALGRAVSWQAAAEAMTLGFAEVLALELHPGPLTAEEWETARLLRDTKYSQPQLQA
jgi:lipoate-protein ligase A